MFKCLGLREKKRRWGGGGGGQKSRWRLDQAQVAQAKYESFITCGLISHNPLKGRGDKECVWEFR